AAISAGTQANVAATSNAWHAINGLLSGNSNCALNIDGTDSSGLTCGFNTFPGTPIRIMRGNGTQLVGSITETGLLARAVLSCIWALAGLNAAHAWPVKGNPANSGSAILNIGGPEFVPANFINVLKTSETSFSTASDILKIDDDGYLTSTPAGNLNLAFPGFGAMFTNVQYRLRVDGDVQFAKLRFLTNMTSCSTSGTISVSGCTGSGNTDIAATGSGVRTVTFTTNTTQFVISFIGGNSASRTSGGIALYRVSDETDFLSGEIFTPEFKSVVAALNPRAIRPMGWVQVGAANFNGESIWANRIKPTALNW
ncbi:hypothetical protein KXW38_008521, partial [Aspergillus fumigatus]